MIGYVPDVSIQTPFPFTTGGNQSKPQTVSFIHSFIQQTLTRNFQVRSTMHFLVFKECVNWFHPSLYVP